MNAPKATTRALRILCVSTKTPWPPTDGGRLVLWNTLEAIARSGHRITLVAPRGASDERAVGEKLATVCRPHLVATLRPPRSFLVARSWWRGSPVSVGLHEVPEARREVGRLLDTDTFDVVHAEQIQALAQCAPALDRGIPVVLRCQNVESEVWRAYASRALLRPLVLREAERVARHETESIRATAATIALSALDRDRLGALSGVPEKIHHLMPPFPAELPARSTMLSGAPPLVLLDGHDWFPGREGASWFLSKIWPGIHTRLPAARLHVFGARGRRASGLVEHAAPADSIEAFAPGAILVVPLRSPAGVRMKILEAWARGVPVVATSAAAAGLEAEPGRDLLLARDDGEFSAAIEALQGADRARALVDAGRSRLRRHHDPASIAGRLVSVYERVSS